MAGNGGIHNIGAKLENALGRLEKNEVITGEAKKAIRGYIEDMASRGLSEYRQVFYLTHLPPFAVDLGEAFGHPTEAQVKAAVAKVERSGLSEWSKVNKRTAIKAFFKWHLGGGEEYPPAVKWIKTTYPNSKRKLPEDLPTREEIKALIDAALNPRDRALISLLADGGLRIGEALTLRLKDWHADRLGGFVIVNEGKTGARRVRLIDSVPHIAAWAAAHPFRGDREAPLFCYLGAQEGGANEGHAPGEGLRYHAARAAILRAAKRADVPTAKVNPHNFRHYAATRLARKVPEAPLEAQLGWVPGSKMAKIYVHLSGRDQDEAILRAHGIEIGEAADEQDAGPRQCPRCEAWNEDGADYCVRCGMALTEDAVAAEAPTERFKSTLDEFAKFSPGEAEEIRELIQVKAESLMQDMAGYMTEIMVEAAGPKADAAPRRPKTAHARRKE